MTVRNGGALPGSWVTLADMPCSSTPAEWRYQALRYRHCGLPLFVQRRLRELAFEAQSHGLHAPCVRFAAGVAPGPRNTRFRWIASPYRSGTFTRRVTIRGFRSSGFPLHVLPPLPGLAWRKRITQPRKWDTLSVNVTGKSSPASCGIEGGSRGGASPLSRVIAGEPRPDLAINRYGLKPSPPPRDLQSSPLTPLVPATHTPFPKRRGALRMYPWPLKEVGVPWH